jgi:hypothetical protein
MAGRAIAQGGSHGANRRLRGVRLTAAVNITLGAIPGLLPFPVPTFRPAGVIFLARSRSPVACVGTCARRGSPSYAVYARNRVATTRARIRFCLVACFNSAHSKCTLGVGKAGFFPGAPLGQKKPGLGLTVAVSQTRERGLPPSFRDSPPARDGPNPGAQAW